MEEPKIEGPFPVPERLGSLLRAAIARHMDGACDDPECKSCNGKKTPVRDMTDAEFDAHMVMTSFVPAVGQRVRLNNFGKSLLNFPGDGRNAKVIRVLQTPRFDPEGLHTPLGALDWNVVLGFVAGQGRVIELIYPGACLELAEG